MYDEVDQFVFVHLFGVEICDQEADVVAFDGFASQHHEVFGSHHHETRELVAENFLDLVGLLHGDADPHRIHTALDEYAFLFVTRDDHGRQYELFAAAHFHLGLVVSFDDLRREIGQTHSRVQCVSNGRQIWFQCGRHLIYATVPILFLYKRVIKQTADRMHCCI